MHARGSASVALIAPPNDKGFNTVYSALSLYIFESIAQSVSPWYFSTDKRALSNLLQENQEAEKVSILLHSVIIDDAVQAAITGANGVLAFRMRIRPVPID